MNVSLDRTSPFERLKWGHVLELLTLLGKSTYTESDHIRRRYRDGAAFYDETLAFASAMGLVREDEGQLRASQTLARWKKEEMTSRTIDILFGCRTRYRDLLLEYLAEFHVEGGQVVHRPTLVTRQLYSAERNFLMELGIVSYTSLDNFYSLGPDYLSLLVVAVEESKRQHPSRAASDRQRKDGIGLAAERAVIKYEKERLGAELANEIRHVALRNCAAGYDVRSVTCGKHGKRIPRCIEVKAVSPERFEFFWTKNEVRSAQTFRGWYFLYLLPIGAGGLPLIADMKILRDPCAEVLSPESAWQVEPSVFKCSLGPGDAKSGDRDE